MEVKIVGDRHLVSAALLPTQYVLVRIIIDQ
jgi:hypothetical protein